MIIQERNPGETGRDYAYRVMRYNIVYRELKPGTMLSEKEIADQLGLSRTPVREAFIELAKTGIIEVLPQRGSRVVYIDYAMVEEADFVRMALEKAVVELVCGMRTEDDLKELRENVMLQEFYLKNPDHIRLLELDNDFHKKLFQIAGKMQAYTMMEGICVHFDRVRDLSIGVVKDLKVVDDHKKILEAIEAQDARQAAEILTHHLQRFRLEEDAIREVYPEYFEK